MGGSSAMRAVLARLGGPVARWVWVGVGVVVVAGVAVAATMMLAALGEPRQRDSAADGIAVASGATSEALARAIADGEELAAAVAAGDLADPAAHSDLLGALSTARIALGGTTAAAESARLDLVAVIDRVTRSRSAKQLSDARLELVAVIATAVEVHDGTAERVRDEGLRAELQVRIDAGDALLAAATASLADVVWSSQTIAEQTVAVLDSRILGFPEADGQWCRESGDQSSCIRIAFPTLTLPNGSTVELSGGEREVGDSGCYQTDEYRAGRDKAAFLYCPAGESIPDRHQVSSDDAGDSTVDRLWQIERNRLTDLRIRA